jgi:hypothetical protein
MSVPSIASGRYASQIESVLNNLSSTDKQVYDLAKTVFGEKGSLADQIHYQQLSAHRQNRFMTMSTMLRNMTELTRSIIQNMRM